MPLAWQKSTYCPEGNSCVHVGVNPGAGTIHLTESGDPSHSILGAAPKAFAALIHLLKENPHHG